MTGRREFLTGLATFGAATALADVEERPAEAIRIAHMGDPQLGFGEPRGEEGYRNDLKRFEAALERLVDLRPDVVFIAGDMTHEASDLERDWPRLLRRMPAPETMPFTVSVCTASTSIVPPFVNSSLLGTLPMFFTTTGAEIANEAP